MYKEESNSMTNTLLAEPKEEIKEHPPFLCEKDDGRLVIYVSDVNTQLLIGDKELDMNQINDTLSNYISQLLVSYFETYPANNCLIFICDRKYKDLFETILFLDERFPRKIFIKYNF